VRLKLTIEYDGTNYSGWQLQPAHDSIQGRIETALERIFSTPVRVFGSGRTDAGVHARAQVASITLPREFDLVRLHAALNALLPPDIVVQDIAVAPENFDPRHDARSRVYEYRILTRAKPSAFEFRYSWLIRDELDLEAMNECARVFIGEHDFAAFRTLGSNTKTTVRRVFESHWSRDGENLLYRIEANSFLRHMVRAMVATMVEAGRGKLRANDVASILAGGERNTASGSAPPSGLYLVEVRY
jgi:tRNA pseudouridine38-40 synthase